MFNIDNFITIHGRIVRDIQTETGASGVVFARFDVAVGRRGKTDSDKTDFFPCIAFGESAKTLERCFYKGKPIRIAGRMECDPYTAKDGTKRYPWTLKVEAWGFDMGEGGNGSKPQNNAVNNTGGDVQTYDSWEQFEADLPFDV